MGSSERAQKWTVAPSSTLRFHERAFEGGEEVIQAPDYGTPDAFTATFGFMRVVLELQERRDLPVTTTTLPSRSSFIVIFDFQYERILRKVTLEDLNTPHHYRYLPRWGYELLVG